MRETVFRKKSIERLLLEYTSTRDPRLRAAIIEAHEPLVRTLAHRFARPGVPVEDLIQSAWVALIGALDRYDPSHQAQFGTYAVHCVVGEIKRYFRDRTWSLKAPRRLQEIAANLGRTQDQLFRKLQRQPTVAEMAEAFQVSEDELLQAMDLSRASQPCAWDDRRDLGEGSDTLALTEIVGARDPDLEAVVELAPLQRAINTLDRRKRTIVRKRFLCGCSQQEVADELGLSQMHVSRLERSALRQLRDAMAAP